MGSQILLTAKDEMGRLICEIYNMPYLVFIFVI
jgi:hypothetical protein